MEPIAIMATSAPSDSSSPTPISRGEFGSLLHGVFDPRSAAEFHFERWTSVNGLRAPLYSYRVVPGNARYQLLFFDESLGSTISAQVGQRGELVIDPETHAVLRITSVAEKIPRSFPVRSSSIIRRWSA